MPASEAQVLLAVVGIQEVEQGPDLEVVECRVAEVTAAVDLVAVAPSDLGSREVALGDQVGVLGLDLTTEGVQSGGWTPWVSSSWGVCLMNSFNLAAREWACSSTPRFGASYCWRR